MSTLAMAMLLTGAGEVQRHPPPRRSGPEVILMAPPPPMAPPVMVAVPPPPAPPPPQTAAPAQRLRANLDYFAEDDYPAAALRGHHEGTTVFDLEIGTTGRVTNCTVTRSSGSAPLDQATCRILRSRARYIPARLADGSAGTAIDHGRVNWRLPEEDGRAGVPMAAQPAQLLTDGAERVTAVDLPRGAPAAAPEQASGLRVAVGLQGRVIGCDVEDSSGSVVLDAAACRLFATRARFAPAHDVAGAPVCDVIWTEIDWRAGFPATQPRRRAGATPAARAPGPLRAQLRDQRCPGWSPT